MEAGIGHLQVRRVVQARLVAEIVQMHGTHLVAGAQMGGQGGILDAPGLYLLDVLLRRHAAGVLAVAGDAPARDPAAQVEAGEQADALLAEHLGDAHASEVGMHRDVRAVERVSAQGVGRKRALAGDLGVRVPRCVVVQLHDQRGGVTDHAPVEFRQELSVREGGQLHAVVARLAQIVLREIGIRRPLACHDGRNILHLPAADPDLGFCALPACILSLPAGSF